MPENKLPAATAPVMASAGVRWLVSALVLAHLAAVLTAVLSCSTNGFAAPQLAVLANEPVRPYLQFTFLNNAYRFFAPNPGVPTVFWFRLQYEDGRVRWVESPGRSSTLIRGAYQRRLNHTIQLGQQLAPDPAQGGKRCITPMGKICLESCVRHVVQAHARCTPDEHLIGVKSVGVYVLHHTVISPEQVRDGWTPTDLRTYHATFVGAYTADSRRTDEFQPGVFEQPICHVAAGVLEVDVYPLLRRGEREAVQCIEELGLPTPLQRLFTTRPELLEPTASGTRLQERIEKLVADGR